MKAYKAQLEIMLEELIKELHSIGILDPHNPSDWIAIPESVDTNEPDENLAADVVEEWDERQALVATLERRYNDLNRALAKVDTDAFGICEICTAAIESDRLDVNPAARTCKAHMDEEEALTE